MPGGPGTGFRRCFRRCFRRLRVGAGARRSYRHQPDVEGGPMRTRRVLAVVLALALTGGLGACTSGGRNGGSGHAAPAGPSAWDLTQQRVGPDGRVDLPTALSAFALAIGPVPGGTPVPGPATAIPSGTIA